MLALSRAFAQLADPVFQGVIWRSLALSAAVFLALLAAAVYGVRDLVAGLAHAPAWVAWLAAALGGIGAALVALYSFMPAAAVIASLYIERVAAAVERAYYPHLPAGAPATLVAQTWDGVALGLKLVPLQLLTLILTLLVPGIGLVLGLLITGWAIGRGLFVCVAMRRMARAAALETYRRRRAAVLLPGVALAALGLVPFANLLVPVLATAAMVHVLNIYSTRRDDLNSRPA